MITKVDRSEELEHSVLRVGFSRRGFLRTVAAAAVVPAMASLLSACGGESADSQQPATTPSGGTGGAASPSEATTPAGAATSTTETAGEPKRGGTLHWYLPDDPPDLDPHMQTTSSLQWVLGMCYNGLLRYDVGPGKGPESVEASTPIPDLAERYEVVDPTTYVFTLRQGVKFHDGTELTAEDVAFSLDRIRTNSPEFQRAYAFTPVDTIEATDPTTVTVKMKEPYAAFINQVAAAYTRIAPKHVIEAQGDMKQTIVGTGPFKLESYQRGQRLVVVRNEDYWEEGIPYLDRIDMAIMPDNSTQLAAFIAKQLDIYEALNYSQVETIQNTVPDVVVMESAIFGLNGIGCNTSVKPLDDVRVRQALFYAIDQQQIIDIVMNGHGVKQRAVPAGYAGWVVPYDELPLGDGPNIEKAKQLLAEAGYPDGFSITCKTVYRYTQREATVAAEQLKAIGVNVELIDVEYGAFLQARNSGDFELIAFALAPFGDIEDFTTALYHTQGSRNFGGWGNVELDELLDQGRRELDEEKRKEIFRRVQEILAENCWVIDLPRETFLEVWHPYVKDYVSAQNPERGLAFWRTWLDK